LTPGEYPFRDLESWNVRVIGPRAQIGYGHGRKRHVRSGLHVPCLFRPGRFDLSNAWDSALGLLDTTKILVRAIVKLFLIKIADDDQVCVIRPVVERVKGASVGRRGGVQLVEIPDNASLVRVRRV